MHRSIAQDRCNPTQLCCGPTLRETAVWLYPRSDEINEVTSPSMLKRFLYTACAIVICGCQSGATQLAPPAPVAQGLDTEIVFYAWPEDATSLVFDAFTAETGIRVRHEPFDSLDEAEEAIEHGGAIDVAIIESTRLPRLIEAGVLAELNFSHIPNFKYVSQSFRDLNFDPGNRHSVPNSWGTTGIVVRTDRTEQPIERWSDLWRPDLAGRVVLWATQPRDTLGLALRSLGYSANSVNPAEIQEAADRLVELAPNAIWLKDADSSASSLIEGDAVAAMGWAFDFWALQEAGVPAGYVLPADGAMLWNDNFVIPAHSTNKVAAEALINFLLRPEIAAQVIEANYYPMAHETARAYVDPAIRDDPVVYPTNEALAHAELQMPLSEEGQIQQDAAWLYVLSSIP
ncbi:MAG: spermidine/putrescine ABC transporter substrate-binding protein [Caldilinea sp.]|nr:spermidine/putrescine ABC transporter substrate-binding protein [Caldilinea sp.]